MSYRVSAPIHTPGVSLSFNFPHTISHVQVAWEARNMDHGIWRDWPPTPAYRSPDWRVDAVCKTELEKDATVRRVSKESQFKSQIPTIEGGWKRVEKDYFLE